MKLVRVEASNAPQWAILDALTDELVGLDGSPYQSITPTNSIGNLQDFRLLAPCVPGKIVALAYNYRDLVGERSEFDEPLIFFKSPQSVIAPGVSINIPPEVNDVWVEVEIAYVIKEKASNVMPENASKHILGYTIGNDVTARNIHGRDHHLARSKGLDTFCPVGPILETELDTSNLEMSTFVAGERTQHSTSSQRILDDSQSLSLISKFITLNPGDLVLTGTPAGAMESVIREGDTARLVVEHLGELINPVTSGTR